MKLMLSTLVATALIATACGEVAPEPRGAVTSGCVGKSASSPVCQPGALPQSSNTETNDGNNKTRTTQTPTKKDSVVPSGDDNETLTPETKKSAQQQNNIQNGNQNGLGSIVGGILPKVTEGVGGLLGNLFGPKPAQQQGQNQPAAAPAATCPSTCKKTELSTCLQFGGGNSCYAKWGCTTACR